MKYLSWFLGWSFRLTKPVRQLPRAVRRFRQSTHRHNVMGSVVVTLALGYLYVHAQPTMAGTDPISLEGGQSLADVTQEFNSSEKSQTSVATNDTPSLTDKEALTECDRILSEAEAKLEKIAAYSATFVKQERIGDALTELQVIQLRISQQPKRVSMKWEGGKDAGQRVIYAEGENDGDMLVRPSVTYT